MISNYLFLRRSSMSYIRIYSLIFTVLTASGCNEKKTDLASGSGKYFVETLGVNVNRQDLDQSVVVEINNGNYSYRYGSLNGKLFNTENYNRISQHTRDNINIYAKPSFYKGNGIILNSAGKITKFKTTSDSKISKIWTKDLNINFCSELSTDVKDNIIIATCGSNIIRGFDFENGQELWKFEVDQAIASQPLFIGDFVVFFAKNDAAYSINYKSGVLEWYIPNVINTNNRSLFSAIPLQIDKYVIQQTYDDQVRGINFLSGQVEWISSIANPYKNVKGKEFLNHYGNSAYDVENRTMYLNNSSGSIVKLKIGANKPDWIVPAVVSKPVWLLDNIVVAVDDLGSIFALSKFDGKVIWSNNILEKIIKKGDEKDIFGKPKPYNEIVFTPPVVIDRKIIIISNNKKLIVISPENGRILEVKNYSQNIFSEPFIFDGKAYVMTDNGKVIIQL